ncbi:unnamed protein product [Menidia menidia]|uniref:(Atlantic silverside) hypothetical protein n=1 Tax=Menidia menidia TaxID=238744 RepID=A0A8S4BDY7_9TELE|nr:unnamed protein product [Menidia menidia]
MSKLKKALDDSDDEPLMKLKKAEQDKKENTPPKPSGSNTDGDSDNEPLVKMAKVSSKAARKPRSAAPRKSASRKKRASPQKDDSSDDDEPLSQIAKKVSNTGKTLQTLGSAFLNVMWPYGLTNEKWLLYPASLKFEGHPDTHCSPTGALNPLKLQSSSIELPLPTNEAAGRKRRSHAEEEDQVIAKGSVVRTTPAVAASERRRSLKLDCLLGSARCVLFQCPLHSFSGQAVLKIHARLWNSSFIEEFSSVSALELLVRANITVKSSIKHLVLREAAAQIPVMIYPEPGLADQYWIPWWIILIAVLAGILLLTLLVCILWKRSERRPHYETEYYRAHLGVQPSEVEKQASEL